VTVKVKFKIVEWWQNLLHRDENKDTPAKDTQGQYVLGGTEDKPAAAASPSPAPQENAESTAEPAPDEEIGSAGEPPQSSEAPADTKRTIFGFNWFK
jgi:hypothetical protein